MKKFANFIFNQTSVLKLIVNTNNVSELIRWRKIRWRLFFIWSNTYSCISRVFCLSSSTHYISIGTKFEKFDFTKFFIYYHIDRQDQDESFFYLIKYVCMYLKSVFSENRVKTWVQVVSCQKSMPLIGRPDRSAPAFLAGNHLNSCSDSDLR